MNELDIGVIPVCEDQRLVGMVTDRDIVLRAVAQDRSPGQTTLKDVMTSEACWCFEDQSVEEVTEQMKNRQIRRFPVVNRQKQLVGMLSLGDAATQPDESLAGNALKGISRPSDSEGGAASKARPH